MESAERKSQKRRRRLPEKCLCVAAALSLPSDVRAHGRFLPKSIAVHRASCTKSFFFLRGGDTDDFEASNEESSGIRSSPFLDQFQEEVHRIVSDYREEVRKTFEQLREDLMASQEVEEESAKDEAIMQKQSPAFDESLEFPTEESEELDAPLEEENNVYFPFKKAGGEELLVGDTDEEEEHVLERLSHSEEAREEGSDTVPVEGTFDAGLDPDLLKSTMTKPQKKKRKKKKKKRVPRKNDLSPEEEFEESKEEPIQTVIGFAPPSAARTLQVQLSRSLSVTLSLIILYLILNVIMRILSRMLGRKG